MIPGFENLGLRWRQMRFNPLRSLTPERLASALDQAAAGWLREQALICEVIEQREAIVRSVMTKRRAAVARRDWNIITPDPDHPQAEAHKATLEYFYNNLTCTDATDLNVRTGVSGLLRQMMDAIIQRYAVHEIVWQPGPAGLTAELRRVPLYFFENRSGKLRFVGPENRADGTDLEDGGWMVTVADGLGEALAICYMYKRMGVQDLLAFSEKFSIPGVLGRTSAKKDSPEGLAMRESVLAYASEWVGLVYGDDGAIKDPIQVVQTPAGGVLPQMTIAEYMDRMIATLVRGGDLSTISRDDATGSNPQHNETAALLEDDCALVSETLQTQLDRLVIRMVHGDETPAAYIVINPPDTTDFARELAVDEGLARLGVKQRPEDLAEKYGREHSEEIEDRGSEIVDGREEEDVNRKAAKAAKGREGEDEEIAAENYNPNQARVPGGQGGGRWIKAGGGGPAIIFGSLTQGDVQAYLEKEKQAWVDASMDQQTSGPTEGEEGHWFVNLADGSTEEFMSEEEAQARLDSERAWFEDASITIEEDSASLIDDNGTVVIEITRRNGQWEDYTGGVIDDLSGGNEVGVSPEDTTIAKRLFENMPIEEVNITPRKNGRGFEFIGRSGGAENYEINGHVEDGELHIGSMLPKDGKSSVTGSSKGTGLLVATVDAAGNAGLRKIMTTGGKGGDSMMTGYRTWPALGFDVNAGMASSLASKITPEIATLAGDPPSLLKLTSTKEGRMWWRKNGESIPLEFDLSQASPHMARLNQVKQMLSR